jgi:hypothetical protein
LNFGELRIEREGRVGLGVQRHCVAGDGGSGTLR